MNPTVKVTVKTTILKTVRRAILWIKEKIYRWLVLFFFKKRFKISEGSRHKHTYIVAGTGAGKSEFLKTLIRAHIIYGKTAMVVIDANGDFAEQVAKFK